MASSSSSTQNLPQNAQDIIKALDVENHLAAEEMFEKDSRRARLVNEVIFRENDIVETQKLIKSNEKKVKAAKKKGQQITQQIPPLKTQIEERQHSVLAYRNAYRHQSSMPANIATLVARYEEENERDLVQYRKLGEKVDNLQQLIEIGEMKIEDDKEKMKADRRWITDTNITIYQLKSSIRQLENKIETNQVKINEQKSMYG